MHLSMLLSSLPLDFEPAVREAAAMGFGHVDVVGRLDRPESHREALAETGLLVSCAAMGRDLPAGQTLDAADVSLRRAAVDAMKQHLADAAQLGATHAYVVPGQDHSDPARARYADACVHLADYAAKRMVRLCVEHIPGRALPTVAATLEWLHAISHDNLFLLLDIGHCLISKEDPAEAVSRAKDRLGYVHLDDNDGANDVHWPLLAGQLTEAGLRSFLHSLRKHGYDGALTLELNAQQPNVIAALREGKEWIERFFVDG